MHYLNSNLNYFGFVLTFAPKMMGLIQVHQVGDSISFIG